VSCVQLATAARRTVTFGSGSTPQALAATIKKRSVFRTWATDHLGTFSIRIPSSSERVEHAVSRLYPSLR
jgi:hypothetical protein